MTVDKVTDGRCMMGNARAHPACLGVPARVFLSASPPSFAAPVVVPGLASPGSHDDDPTVTTDLLELYFSSDRPGGPGGESIWRANRATPADPWGTPTLVTELSSDAADNDAEISADGLTIWIASTGPRAWVTTCAIAVLGDRESP